MKKEVNFYISILADFLNERKTEPVNEIDWKLLCDYALSQNTNGIVYYQCKDFIIEPYRSALMKNYMAEIYAYGNRMNLTREIEKAFNDNNVTYCLVKGPVVAANYPIPALRTMGDSDFVVNDKTKEKAYSLMEELGYELKFSLNERAYFKNHLEFEVHHSLTYELDEDNLETKFCQRVWDYVKDNKLDSSYHFIFLLLHLKKHLITEGVGFRQFMDLAVEIKKSELDWDFINEEVEKMNLTKFMNVCLSLTYRWFDIKAEREIIPVEEEFFNESTLKILNNGVHGFDDEDNMATPAFKAMSRDGDVNTFSKIKYMLQLYFPPFEYFRNDVNYEFLRKRPYLLPCAWIYRFYLSLKNNNAMTEIKRSLKGLFMSKKEIDRRKSNNDNWGL